MIPGIASRVRKADADEFWASTGMTAEQTIVLGAHTGAHVGMADGVPFCVFGVSQASLIGSVGIPWMVGTVELDHHAYGFLKHCRPVVDRWADRFDLLVNYVDARNTRAIRWLKWLGFEFGEPEPYGWLGMPFIRFWRGHV